jgi:hypothetical protein
VGDVGVKSNGKRELRGQRGSTKEQGGAGNGLAGATGGEGRRVLIDGMSSDRHDGTGRHWIR